MSSSQDPRSTNSDLATSARRSGRWLWIGLVALFAIGTAVSLYMALRAPSRVQDSGNEYAVSLVRNSIEPVLTPADLAKPVTGSRYDELETLAEKHIFTDGRTVRITVWREDKLVTFSTEKTIVGRKPRVATSTLEDSLRGDVTSAVFDPSEKQSRLPGIAEKTLRTYVPLQAVAGGSPPGSVEVDQTYSEIQPSIDKLWWPLVAVFAIGLIICLVATPSILSGSRKLPGRSQKESAKAPAGASGAQAGLAGTRQAGTTRSPPKPAASPPGGGAPVETGTEDGSSQGLERRLRQAEKRAELAEERARQTAALALQDKEKLRALEAELKRVRGGGQPAPATPLSSAPAKEGAAAPATAAGAAGAAAVAEARVKQLQEQVVQLESRLKAAEMQRKSAESQAKQQESEVRSGAERLRELEAGRADLETKLKSASETKPVPAKSAGASAKEVAAAAAAATAIAALETKLKVAEEAQRETA